MNNKGQLELRKMIYWVIVILMLSMALIAFAMATSTFKSRFTQTPLSVKAELMVLRFTNNPDCFAYQGLVTERTFSGVIDLKKFNSETLHKCYLTSGTKEFNFLLNLTKTGKIVKNKAYYYKDDLILNKYVLVKKGDKIERDTLKIHVQKVT
jgi:hypothetical protein